MSEMVARAVLALRTYRNATNEIQARKIIEAMRDPTENMLFVGSNEDAGYHASDLRISWQLMIDEALK